MEIYQKYQGRQKSTFKISKYVIILSTDLNITRLECKLIYSTHIRLIVYNLNITRLECKYCRKNEKDVGGEVFEYHQIGM